MLKYNRLPEAVEMLVEATPTDLRDVDVPEEAALIVWGKWWQAIQDEWWAGTIHLWDTKSGEEEPVKIPPAKRRLSWGEGANLDRCSIIDDNGQRWKDPLITVEDLQWLEGKYLGASSGPDEAGGGLIPTDTPRPRFEKGYWPLARAQAFKWLEDEGEPAELGDQGKLERHIADYLGGKKIHPSESTIRRHVSRWIGEFREAKLSY